MKKAISQDRVRLNGASVMDSHHQEKDVKTVEAALRELTRCGCGIECKCFGYLTLPDYNSTTGEIIMKAIYLVDGAVKVATVEDAEAELTGYQDLQ